MPQPKPRGVPKKPPGTARTVRYSDFKLTLAEDALSASVRKPGESGADFHMRLVGLAIESGWARPAARQGDPS